MEAGKPGDKSDQQMKAIVLAVAEASRKKSDEHSRSQPTNPFELAP